MEEAAPSYVFEKGEVFSRISESDALSLLDAPNQQRVRAWCSSWHVDVPTVDREL